MAAKGNKPSKKDCEEMAAGLGKLKVSLKEKLPLGRKCKEGEKGDEPAKKKYTLKDRINDIKTGFAEISRNVKDKKAQNKAMTSASCDGTKGSGKRAVSSRQMLYPYTVSAKIAQFPYKFYVANCWFFRYTLYAIVASTPFFMFLGTKSHSPRNVAEWEEKRREMFTPHH